VLLEVDLYFGTFAEFVTYSLLVVRKQIFGVVFEVVAVYVGICVSCCY